MNFVPTRSVMSYGIKSDRAVFSEKETILLIIQGGDRVLKTGIHA